VTAKTKKADPLTLRFLGELEIRRADTALALPQSRKTRALLAYLAFSGGPHRRERLCSLLWDVTDDPRAALRWSLSKLRPLVDDPGARRIVSEGDSIGFEARGATVDFLQVRARLAGGTESLPTETLLTLASEFRGDFLEGLELPDFFGFQSWCLAQREEARRVHATIRRTLIERFSARPEEALVHAQRLAELEPYDEEAHASVVRALTVLGRAQEAERQSVLSARMLEEAGVPASGRLREALALPAAAATAGTPAPRTSPPVPASGIAAVAPETPQTRYARNGDVSIAYQVVGKGPIDLVLVPGWVSHVEYAWEVPSYARFLRRLTSFARLILLDRRGTGLSDRVADLPSLEERMEDTRAVMDAAGVQRAALFGISEGGAICATFAASYPERTSALVLGNTTARLLEGPDYPLGTSRDEFDRFMQRLDDWGTGHTVKVFAPSAADDPDFIRSWARLERFAVSPAGIRLLLRMNADIDVRHVLSAITAPTLVVHRADDKIIPAAAGRSMAERISGAHYVEVPGADHFLWTSNIDVVLDEVERFLTRVRATDEFDRQLMTLLFTDVAQSKTSVNRRSDRSSTERMARHSAMVRQELAAFRGSEIRHAGDGLLAGFDGPARAIRCGARIVAAGQDIGLDVRAGVHTGECERRDGDLRGLALDIGARVAALAEPGEVLVSQTVRDLIAGSAITLESRGCHVLEGIPGEWCLYAVRD
jgi:pimeloyl-ACP methyl ester carboxylesterase/DNA-binding SARP family transcriptional activator/class 3 adenylate cyclase